MRENRPYGSEGGVGESRSLPLSGAPAFALLHVGSGFANGIAMLHNAGRANTPIVNVVGANASYHQPNYPEHELINGRVADLARTVSHWSQEARSASNLASSARRPQRSRGPKIRGFNRQPGWRPSP